jgi:flagellar protein FlbT
MNISLRRGEKLYLNGAVIRVDRKVSVELLNDATFLLENHVMQESDARTPLKQLYFVIQLMIMSPNDVTAALHLCKQMLRSLAEAFDDPNVRLGLVAVARHVEQKKWFEALKTVRQMYEYESTVTTEAPPDARVSA